jgi:hypothetical protein
MVKKTRLHIDPPEVTAISIPLPSSISTDFAYTPDLKKYQGIQGRKYRILLMPA